MLCQAVRFGNCELGHLRVLCRFRGKNTGDPALITPPTLPQFPQSCHGVGITPMALGP